MCQKSVLSNASVLLKEARQIKAVIVATKRPCSTGVVFTSEYTAP